MSEWISVKDKLPKSNKYNRLIAFRDDGDGDGFIDCDVTYFKGKFYKFNYQYEENLLINDVTHWMPLPEPPKEN